MRVLIVNSYYYPNELGGAEVSVRKLAEELAKKNIEVFVLCNGKRGEEIINNVRVIRREFNKFEINKINSKSIKSKIYKKVASTKNIFKRKIIREAISEVKPNIIHVNNVYNISTEVWKISKSLSIPIVQTLRDYFLLCPKANLICNGKVCSEKNFICRLYDQYNKKYFKNVNFITAPSKYTLEKFKEYGMIDGIDSKVIYNAIDSINDELINIRKIRKDRLMDYKIRLCYLGSLTEYKGIKDLIEIFNDINLENIELHIAGNGYLEKYIEKAVIDNNCIFYHGKLNENEVEDLLLTCDVMIVPSKWYEPFGRVVIDGYKYGMPSIASNMGGLSEIVIDGKTGYLFDINDRDEFKNAIVKLCDKKKIYEMVEECLSMVEKFAIKKQACEFQQLYATILNS